MSEETKGTGKEETGVCCKPEDMQKFFRKMAACCSGPGDTPDCKAMMQSMKEKFCGQKTEATKKGCGD
jgi:hypothetical protein